MDAYIKTLNKLYIKGIIDEKELKQKIEEWENKKEADFETMVTSCIDEAVKNGEIGRMITRIYKQKVGNENK